MPNLQLYADAAAKYRPAKVRLLWVAEAPPSVPEDEPPRYFYFEEMSRHDSLFREVMRAVFPGARIPFSGESKVPLLERFRDAGGFLVDVCKDPRESYAYDKWWPVTSAEIQALDPDRIIAVKVDVCFFVFDRLHEMGMHDRLLVAREVPFPGSGQQGRFHRLVDEPVRRWLEECEPQRCS
jgi:hypothetical protein